VVFCSGAVIVKESVCNAGKTFVAIV